MRATSRAALPALLLPAVAAFVFGQQPRSTAEGIALFEQGRYAQAAAALEGLPDKRARAFAALAQAASGRCSRAAAGLRAAFDDRSDPQVRRLAGLALARCRIAEKSFAAALALLDRLTGEFPDDGDVLYETARLHLKAWNAAVERMFERAPASFRVNQLSAEIFEIRGQFSEAVAEYRRAVEKNPRAVNLHYRLGRALLMESHAPETLAAARREFEAELRLNPNDAVAEFQIAQILEVEGDREAARRRLENAVRLDPDFPEALVALGRALAAQKRYPRAAALLERAVKLAPQSEAAHYNLMLAYRNAGREAEALEVKKRLEELQRPPEGEFTDFLRRIGELPQR